MARLPQPGGDEGSWGEILNEYLSQSLDSGGLLKPDAIVDGAISEAKLSQLVRIKLEKADTALQSVSKSDIGLSNVDNVSDLDKPISSATQTALTNGLAQKISPEDVDSKIANQNALNETLYAPIEYSKLRKWYAHLARRNANLTQIVCLGDSITEGTGSSVINRRWQTVLQNNLRARFGVTAGATFAFLPGATLTTTPFPAVARTGNTSLAGKNLGIMKTLFIPDASGSVTFTFTGNRAKLLFTRGSLAAVARIVVDGGTPVTIDTFNGATTSGNVLFDTGLMPSGSHTIIVSRDASSVNGRAVYIDGCAVFNNDDSAGIRVIDGGYHGINTNNFQLTGSITSGSSTAQVINGLGGAGLLIVAYGTNDAGSAAIPPATMASNIATYISQIRAAGWNGSVLYVAVHKGGGRTDALWNPYVAAIQSLANADPDGVFLNLGLRMPSAPTGNFSTSALGLFADTLHPSDTGHAYIADILTGILIQH
jgi:lysophospholipase L1-like esterase